MLILFYRLFVVLCGPVIYLHLLARVRAGKEDATRLNERFGITDAAPFSDPPLWIHAASVGESLAALTLITQIRVHNPALPIILTTGTLTSSRIMNGRMPDRCVHAFAPLDHPVWVRRFLDHWTPCAAIRIESEIWPTAILELERRRIPLAVMNGRMSERSFSAWQRFPKTSARIFGTIKTILADGIESAAAFRALGAHHVGTMGNIKLIAQVPPPDADALTSLRQMIATRPVWLYACTHADEEIIAADIHQKLAMNHPGLLTLIVPRHAARGALIRTALSAYSGVAFRSDTPSITPETRIYVADTMGEINVFYSLTHIAVIGRSFSNDGGGGHSPVEAALLSAYPLAGPHVQNLDTIYDYMTTQGGAEIVQTPDDLAARIDDLLTHPDVAQANGRWAYDTVISAQDDIRRSIDDFIHDFIPHRTGGTV